MNACCWNLNQCFHACLSSLVVKYSGFVATFLIQFTKLKHWCTLPPQSALILFLHPLEPILELTQETRGCNLPSSYYYLNNFYCFQHCIATQGSFPAQKETQSWHEIVMIKFRVLKLLKGRVGERRRRQHTVFTFRSAFKKINRSALNGLLWHLNHSTVIQK